MTVFVKNLEAQDLIGKIIVTREAVGTVCGVDHLNQIEIQPLLTDGPPVDWDLCDFLESPRLVLSPDEAGELFGPVIDVMQTAGLLSGNGAAL